MTYNGENSFIIGNRGSIDYCDNPYEELKPTEKQCSGCEHWYESDEINDDGYCDSCWSQPE